MCCFEVEWEELLCEWKRLLRNAIMLIEIKSVDPASGKNRDKIVTLLLFFRTLCGGRKKSLPAQL